MKKFLILILGLSLTAASCDLATGTFSLSNPTEGMFLSTDSGQSFHAADTISPKGSISAAPINAIALDPTNWNTVYLASSTGIYKSTDGAQTWQYILSGLEAADIAVDPTTPQTLYAAGIAGTSGKIIESLDGGSSWVDIYTEPSQNNAVLTIAIDPSDPTVILAGLGSGEIIRSTDSGHTWAAATDLSDKIMKIRFTGNHEAYAVSLTKGLSKSLDGGKTWTPDSSKLIEQLFSVPGEAQGTADAFYDVAIDARQAGVLYLGTDSGVFRTVDDGKDWSLLALPLKGAALRASSVTVDPTNSNNLYVAVASTMFISRNGGVTWQTKALPITTEVHAIIVNPSSNNVIYVGVGNTR